jgi:hypothetical protein
LINRHISLVRNSDSSMGTTSQRGDAGGLAYEILLGIRDIVTSPGDCRQGRAAGPDPVPKGAQ